MNYTYLGKFLPRGWWRTNHFLMVRNAPTTFL